MLRITGGLFSGLTKGKEVAGGTLVRIGDNIYLVSAGGVPLYVGDVNVNWYLLITLSVCLDDR